MKRICTLLIGALITTGAVAQTTITNGDFEAWGNASPGLSTEPTSWYSNQSGSTIAALGAQTCFKDISVVHGGTASVRVETISGPFSTVINGNVTTGVVNAPTTTKTDGYIGTVNYTSSTDKRYMNFTGRPDSIVGWYQYTSGGAGEQGKVKAILHTSDYFDPETPTTYHANPTANKIGDATFLTPTSNVSTWTRFAMKINYVSASAPTHIMINVTSSANQATTVVGSKLWLDDLQAVYSSATGIRSNALEANDLRVYSWGKTVYVNFINGSEDLSQFTIYDLSGREVMSKQLINNRDYSFELNNLSAGVYVYQIGNSDLCQKGKLFIQ